jgi:RNA polymerase sigma-70 factor (ECF subfamily)
VSERSFLVATALRVASEKRRSRWNRSPKEDLETVELAIEAAAENDIELRRRRLLLDEALEQLDVKEREVFVLAAIEEMTKSEIATALSIPEGTVASRLQRAKVAFASTVRKLLVLRGRQL